MEDTSWVKQHLIEHFSLHSEKCASLIDEKISLFGGKLYKYYTFEDPYSLKNLCNKTIHFSKPESFNDPFDCALGFSLDSAVEALIPTFLETELKFKGENGEETKQIIKQLFIDEQCDIKGDKTAELISIILSKPQFLDIIKKHKEGEFLTKEDFQLALTKMFFEPQMLENIMRILAKPGNEFVFDNFAKNEGVQTIINTFNQKPEEVVKLLTSDSKGSEKGGEASLFLNTNGIFKKLLKLSEIVGEPIDLVNGEFGQIKTSFMTMATEVKERINNMFAITCFSEESDSILMWSHYANKHTGFCVEYDLTKCPAFAKTMLFPVIYTDKRPTIPMSNVTEKEFDKCLPDFVISLLTKSLIWEYEKEWRIIEIQSNLTDGHLLLADMVSKVYLGANISTENEIALRNALDKNIPIGRYEIDTENYKLNLQEYAKD